MVLSALRMDTRKVLLMCLQEVERISEIRHLIFLRFVSLSKCTAAMVSVTRRHHAKKN